MIITKTLLNNEIVKCTQYRIKSTPSSVDAVQINKIALKNNENKRLKSFNGIATYPYGTSAFIVWIEELKVKQALACYVDSSS